MQPKNVERKRKDVDIDRKKNLTVKLSLQNVKFKSLRMGNFLYPFSGRNNAYF